ncbi:hypothetical protein PS623_04777 [Pseudomonas fluorescens]|nr:hypothetical protein PS623_04777 [Pseudomonas fluorescens]
MPSANWLSPPVSSTGISSGTTIANGLRMTIAAFR